MNTEKEKYQQYLCSHKWWAIRNAVIERCNGICEECRLRDVEHVHHLTYARKYKERLEDLKALCKCCHDRIHQARHEAIEKQLQEKRDRLRFRELIENKEKYIFLAERISDSKGDVVRRLFENCVGVEFDWFLFGRLKSELKNCY
jgi:hypothetical protein